VGGIRGRKGGDLLLHFAEGKRAKCWPSLTTA
jgi:hypothetical protein